MYICEEGMTLSFSFSCRSFERGREEGLERTPAEESVEYEKSIGRRDQVLYHGVLR